MIPLVVVLHVLAFFCFVFAAVPAPWKLNLQAIGLALWMLSLILARV